ncbi:MAG: geranylgeranylglyceryl/heptaprenylglyceryl phosphate synthase [Bacteroidales bacterium]|nr:geranylgeranylglyceryl/heptaprenylglyceryl phosphate synthase [Bacteroidales bacterium]
MFYDILKNKASLAILIDPDKFNKKLIVRNLEIIKNLNFSVILVGGSLIYNDVDEAVKFIKSKTNLPIFLFPGSFFQISKFADGILFTSLISGRNPEFIISQQVQAAPIIKRLKLEVISTAYILIDGDKTSSVEYISNTKPIPADKTDIILATCYAAEIIGFKALYLEAGSGAKIPIPIDVIKLIKKNVDMPLIVGGGIKTINQANNYLENGANLVVLGTMFENP